MLLILAACASSPERPSEPSSVPEDPAVEPALPGVVTSTVGGETLPTLPVVPPANGLGIAAADGDLDLGASVVGANGVIALGDLGADGYDDLALPDSATSGQGYYVTTKYSYELLSDPLHAGPSYAVGSPAEVETYSFGTLQGVSAVASTFDATGDALADLWVADEASVYTLVPGAVLSDVDDPAIGGVATLAFDNAAIELTGDLDGDGFGDTLGELGPSLVRCPGPFAGEIESETCSFADNPGWEDVRPLHLADLDGDGLPEVLAELENQAVGPGTWLAVRHLGVFPAAEPAGPAALAVEVIPAGDPWFSAVTTAFADLDGDGYGDVAWLDDPSYLPVPATPEVAVVHGPLAQGSVLGVVDADLDLVGAASDCWLPGVADTDGDGADSLLIAPQYAPGILLFDASGTGTVDPADTAWSLAWDAPVDSAAVGDFDGDDLDDVVASDAAAGIAVLYLGASLP